MSNNDIKLKKQTYFQGIDGLRALAVLAVMLFHINPSLLGGGFSGVDVFFVISGYVVSSSLFRAYEPNFLRLTLGFYARRILRIIPALITVLIISSIISTLFLPSSWLSSTNEETALAAFFGYSNFALIWFTDSYFSPRVEFNPFLHTWSLSVEEQFYVLFPLLFFVWIKYRNNQNLIGAIANWLIAILFIASLVYAWYETPLHPDKAFYLLPSRFWELASGALLFKLHLQNRLTADSDFKLHLYLILGMVLMLLGFVFSDKTSFPFPWALLSISGTLLLISGVIRKTERKPILQKFLENKNLTYIGKISYSLYLWHWPVYVFFRWTIGLETLWQMFFAILLSFLFAALSYHFIEIPIRRSKRILAKPNWLIVIVGVLVVFMAYSTTKFIFSKQPTLSLSVMKQKEIWYPHRYHMYQSKVMEKKQKIFQDKKLFVMGDSHANAYTTMLKQLSDEYGIKIYKFSVGGCGIANLLHSMPISNQCEKKANAMLSKIEALSSPGDIVFLAALRMRRLGNQWKFFNIKDPIARQLTESASRKRKYALEETKNIIKKLEDASLHVIIDSPKPIFRTPAFRCSDWFNQSNPVCKYGFIMNRNFLLEYRQPVMDSLVSLSKTFPKLTVWDPFPILCQKETCSVFDGDKPLFFDGDHLSGHGNRILYPSFKLVIENILLNEMLVNILFKRISFKSSEVIFSGWSIKEKSYRWSLDKESRIIFSAIHNNKAQGLLSLNISTLGEQEIKVTINDKYIGSQTINGWNKDIQFKFNPEILNKDQVNIILFEFPNARKPDNGDKRVLAMAIRSFMIE